MIVDDDSTISELLLRVINKSAIFPADIKTIDNGKDALTEISSCFYDLCFIDIGLPDLNGLDVMKKIKELSLETKVVVMTAGHVSDDSRKLIEDNADMFINKPFDLLQIKMIVRQASKKNDFYSDTILNKNESASAKDRRLFKRMDIMKNTDYFFGQYDPDGRRRENLRCCLIDISGMGIGIRTHHSLQPGHLLDFNIDGLEHKDGIIRWSIMIDNNTYRAGIEFT